MRNDFTKRECRIQEQMAEVFQRMAEDSTIEFPKPDLSFMEEGTVPGAAEAAGGENEVYPKRRFGFLRRTGAVLCILCAVFVASSGLAVLISDQEAYAGNPVLEVVNKIMTYIKFQSNGKIDYNEEQFQNFNIMEESDLYLMKEQTPVVLIPQVVPQRYKFQDLDFRKYDEDMYTYSYTYINPADSKDILRIDSGKRKQNSQITIYGDYWRVVLQDKNAELYCKNDYSTGGVTGIYMIEEQIINISGDLQEREVIALADSFQ